MIICKFNFSNHKLSKCVLRWNGSTQFLGQVSVGAEHRGAVGRRQSAAGGAGAAGREAGATSAAGLRRRARFHRRAVDGVGAAPELVHSARLSAAVAAPAAETGAVRRLHQYQLLAAHVPAATGAARLAKEHRGARRVRGTSKLYAHKEKLK